MFEIILFADLRNSFNIITYSRRKTTGYWHHC